MRITKKVLIGDASSRTRSEAVDKEIVVKAGWKDGTKITFESAGDEGVGIIPSDVVFTVSTKPHARFSRDGDDLITTVCVSLQDALGGVRTSVPGIDGRALPVAVPYATPDTIVTVAGEGMPNAKVQILSQ